MIILSRLALGLGFIVLVTSGNAQATRAQASEPGLIRTTSSGLWSSPSTWEGGKVPGAGDRVLIMHGHHVSYDVVSSDVIRGITISGKLAFLPSRDTRLEVGLIRIEAGNVYSEEGFDCSINEDASDDSTHRHSQGDHKSHDDHSPHDHHDGVIPTLEIGSTAEPIHAGHRAIIRLHYQQGMNPESCPAILCCGGRMDIHGAPLSHSWVKLAKTADATTNRLYLREAVEGWREGDEIVITGTSRQDFSTGTAAEHVTTNTASEKRSITQLTLLEGRNQMTFGAAQSIQLDAPLSRSHVGGQDYAAEVANLSRNVVIESADPDGPRGHTMYHRDSKGSISYAEFRHLGKRGVLGTYPIHFHLVGDTMRGTSVIGASIWDSHNRWITIHGTQYVVVKDCVGYQSVGHGFFLEDGTETYNIFDRNLAIAALNALPLPKQVLPFDRNDGAGFWWANSLNSFTKNVAVECDQHGFRFEAEKTQAFDPMLSILQPDGTRKKTDIRTLPFICFQDNEAHCQRRFGLNLGGIRGMTHAELMRKSDGSDAPHSIGGTVDGVGPDASHPFVIKRFKVWDTHWSFHAGSPSVTIDGLDVFDCNYGIWRSTIDLHQYDNLSFRDIHAHAIFFPMGGHGPGIELDNGYPSFPSTKDGDDFPPVTVITTVRPISKDSVNVQGFVVDNHIVKETIVNDQPIQIGNSGFNRWSVDVPVTQDGTIPITAWSMDGAGNRELTPHRVDLPKHLNQSL